MQKSYIITHQSLKHTISIASSSIRMHCIARIQFYCIAGSVNPGLQLLDSLKLNHGPSHRPKADNLVNKFDLKQ